MSQGNQYSTADISLARVVRTAVVALMSGHTLKANRKTLWCGSHILLLFACAALPLNVSLAAADAHFPNVREQMNIPSQDLQAALQQLAKASHFELHCNSELLAGKTSRSIKGRFTAHEALRQLLSGTNLSFQITSSSA